MSQPKYGGPAFPAAIGNEIGSDANYVDTFGTIIPPGMQANYPGMTLRDYFAAKAMEGLCANPGGPFQSNDRCGYGIVNCTVLDVATLSYQLGDAMLKAREA